LAVPRAVPEWGGAELGRDWTIYGITVGWLSVGHRGNALSLMIQH